MEVFHLLTKNVLATRDAQETVQNHYVAIADRPSHAVALLEETRGWLGSEKITVEKASPAMVPPDIDLKQSALWQI